MSLKRAEEMKTQVDKTLDTMTDYRRVRSKTNTLMLDALTDSCELLGIEKTELPVKMEPGRGDIIAKVASELFRARFQVVNQAFIVTVQNECSLVPLKSLK